VTVGGRIRISCGSETHFRPQLRDRRDIKVPPPQIGEGLIQGEQDDCSHEFMLEVYADIQKKCGFTSIELRE
jgi:hypothetical protein